MYFDSLHIDELIKKTAKAREKILEEFIVSIHKDISIAVEKGCFCTTLDIPAAIREVTFLNL